MTYYLYRPFRAFSSGHSNGRVNGDYRGRGYGRPTRRRGWFPSNSSSMFLSSRSRQFSFVFGKDVRYARVLRNSRGRASSRRPWRCQRPTRCKYRSQSNSESHAYGKEGLVNGRYRFKKEGVVLSVFVHVDQDFYFQVRPPFTNGPTSMWRVTNAGCRGYGWCSGWAVRYFFTV